MECKLNCGLDVRFLREETVHSFNVRDSICAGLEGGAAVAPPSGKVHLKSALFQSSTCLEDT